MKTQLVILASAFLFSCAATGNHSKTASGPATETSTDDQNNAVSVTDGNPAEGESSNSPEVGDEVIFEGSNNLFELVQTQAAYFDQVKDVIVVKGDGNHIKLYNASMVDMNTDRPDTLVLVGNRVKYVACLNGTPKLKRQPKSVETVQMAARPFATEAYLQDLDENENYTYMIKALLDRINAGEADAYYELGEMYKYGLEGTPVSIDKAVDLYEYGAVRGDKMSIRRLGDLWFNGTFEKAADKAKGRYYYTLGAQLGDQYCIDVLAGK